MDGLGIVPLTVALWPGVREVYAAGIATGHATFEVEPPSWEDFQRVRPAALRLAAVDAGDEVVGWAAATPVSARAVYTGVVEHSVYVSPAVAGRGIGRRLLEQLVAAAEQADVWTIQSGVFPENTASLALHRRLGFRVVGTRERVGLMTHGPLAGRWRDVVLIERRSAVVGTADRPG